MAGPEFPNVPKASGVPAVKRDATNPGTDTQAPLNDDAIIATGAGPNQWGIYTADNTKALEPDTVVSIGYDAEHRIADFPIEEGSFESYDKVEMPFDIRVRMSKGGTREDRRAFLLAIESIRGNTELYSVITPDKTYLNVNFTRVSVDRSREQGAGLVTVELQLREIRQNVTAEFSNSKDPASADTKSDGSVQSTAATPEVKQALQSKAPSAGASFISSAKDFYSKAKDTLRTIPLVSGLPSQSLAVNLASQAVSIAVSQKRTGLFADISVNGVAAAAGVLCRDGVPLLGGAMPSFPGDLAFVDVRGALDPDFSSLGDRFKLVWAG